MSLYRYVRRIDGKGELAFGSSALAVLNETEKELRGAKVPFHLLEVGIGSGAAFEAFQRRSR